MRISELDHIQMVHKKCADAKYKRGFVIRPDMMPTFVNYDKTGEIKLKCPECGGVVSLLVAKDWLNDAETNTVLGKLYMQSRGEVIPAVFYDTPYHGGYTMDKFPDSYHLISKYIKKLIFNDPATIIYWADGSKTVVQCQNGEPFDPEKGLAMAISKKVLGNKHEYYELFAKEVGRYYKKIAKEN